GVSSGYLPVGGVVVSPTICAPFWDDGTDATFKHGLTYSGHATCAAAALANLDIIAGDGLLDRVRHLEPLMDAGLQSLADHRNVAEIRSGAGLIGSVVSHDADGATRLYAALQAE